MSEPDFFCERLTAEEVALAGEDLPLKSDIEALGRVAGAQAVEAVVFYAGRILEMVARRAMADLELPGHGSVLGSLMVLEQFSLMPLGIRYCAHALRRLANDARHVLRHLEDGDGETARALNDVWLRWYFCGFAFGPRLRATSEGSGRVHSLLLACEAGRMETVRELLQEDAMWRSPALIGVAAEALLRCDALDAARDVIDRGLERFKEDVRLRILDGLQLSRAKMVEEAIRVMEPLHKRYRGEDEAAGILAGAYKRMWMRDERDMSWLEKAFKTYHAGWRQTGQENSYLGANAATTALLLDDVGRSEQIARVVRERMQRRIERLQRKLQDPITAMEFWDAVTVAELDLLLGEAEAARAIYDRVFEKHAESTGNIGVARSQAGMIARRKALSGFESWQS